MKPHGRVKMSAGPLSPLSIIPQSHNFATPTRTFPTGKSIFIKHRTLLTLTWVPGSCLATEAARRTERRAILKDEIQNQRFGQVSLARTTSWDEEALEQKSQNSSCKWFTPTTFLTSFSLARIQKQFCLLSLLLSQSAQRFHRAPRGSRLGRRSSIRFFEAKLRLGASAKESSFRLAFSEDINHKWSFHQWFSLTID